MRRGGARVHDSPAASRTGTFTSRPSRITVITTSWPGCLASTSERKSSAVVIFSPSTATIRSAALRSIDLRFVGERALLAALLHDAKAAQAGLLGRAAGRQRGDQQSVLGLQHAGDAGVGADHAAVLDQLRHDAGDVGHRNGKAHAGALAGGAGDGRVHADQPAVAVQQRPARVARIDRRVDLNDRLDRAVIAGRQRAVQAGNDAGRQRPLQPERVADGEHPLADAQVRRIAEA